MVNICYSMKKSPFQQNYTLYHDLSSLLTYMLWHKIANSQNQTSQDFKISILMAVISSFQPEWKGNQPKHT